MDENDCRELARLYKIANAIGNSLDTEAMLTAALGAFVEQLACTAGAIFLASSDVLPDEPAVAFPAALNDNAAVQIAASLLPAHITTAQWRGFCQTLPQQGRTVGGDAYLLLAVGEQGMVVLFGHRVAVSPAFVTALTPLLARLLQAYQNCLQNAELASAHRSETLENSILRTLLETTPTILFALDSEGTCTYSEGSGLELSGRKPNEVVGQPVSAIFGDMPQLLDSIESARAGERHTDTIQVGNRVWDVTYGPIGEDIGVAGVAGGGKRELVGGVVGVAHDVTEHRAAMKALSAVLQTVGEGILSLDEEGRILMVNTELEHIFGYAEGELAGASFDSLLAAADALPSFLEQRDGAPAWRGLLGVRFETEGRRKDGSSFPVDVCINELAPGLSLRYTGSLRDISERREYDRLRDEFVSTVSHELRTPLASIMGWTETLLTEHPGPINDTQRRFLNTVYASSQRLNRLIEEILTVSRIQRGTLRVNNTPMSPNELLASVSSDLAPSAARQGVRLHFEDLWPADEQIMGDPHLLEQVLNNLIGNAVKFSPQDSDVFVRSRLTPIGWRVEVEDHGMGVRAADLPKLFNRFVRGSNAKEAHTQGAGLGLFVSKAIVEAHGGTIYLTSREGEGTTVAYELPRQRSYGSTELSYVA